MNTYGHIIRQKAIYEKVCDFKANGIICNPREDFNGVMYVVSHTGEIFIFSEGSSEQIYTMSGQPNCICFDASGNLYVADISQGAIYFKSPCNLKILNLFIF